MLLSINFKKNDKIKYFSVINHVFVLPKNAANSTTLNLSPFIINKSSSYILAPNNFTSIIVFTKGIRYARSDLRYFNKFIHYYASRILQQISIFSNFRTKCESQGRSWHTLYWQAVDEWFCQLSRDNLTLFNNDAYLTARPYILIKIILNSKHRMLLLLRTNK